jgi:hypothetical protein
MAVAALERILATGTVDDGQGTRLPLHSGISFSLDTSACIRCRSIARTLEVSGLVPVQL